MGWFFLALFGAAAFAALALLGVRKSIWSMTGSALMLGAAGYALQGRPGLSASPAHPDLQAEADSPELIGLRDRMLGRYSGDGAYVIAADAMTRAGEPRAAVQAILGGIKAVPESVFLWTALGNVLSAHDGNQVSPPALFAFQQASRLSPRHPAPPFFLGQAYVRAGDFGKAQPYWRRAVELTPAGASYQPDLRLRLAVLARFLVLRDEAARRGR